MSANNSEKEEKPQQEDPEYNQNEIKEPQEEDQKENMVEQAPKENKKIFVKNIPFNTTDTQLSEFFSRFANVEKAEIMKRDNGSSSGVGFVELATVEEKKNILTRSRDDFVIDGRRLDIKEARLERMDYSKTLYVGNLSYSTNEETLKKYFIDNIQDLKGDFKVNIQTINNGKPKGYAYIEFENEEDVTNALKINGQKLDDRALTVEMKKSRGTGSFRGRGRGRFQGGMSRRGGFGGRRYDHERNNYYRDRSRGRSYERSRDRSRDRERERDRRRDREKVVDRDRDRDRDRERYRGDRDRDRDRERERERDRERDRNRGERDRDRDRERERGDRERGDRDRGDRERERERGDRDRERERERERERGDRDRERERSRERRHMNMDRNQA